jgi:hypothetical protein
MKKLFTILLFTLCSFAAFSQQKGSFEFGFNVGYNIATVQSGSLTNTEFRSGVNIGASGDYFFSDRWSLKAKLSYDQKGWNKGFITDLDKNQSAVTNYHFDYLTIPVMANWHFGKTRNWYLNFGPYAGVLLSAKETALHKDLKDFSNGLDLGFAFGIGVKIPVADKIKIVLEADGQGGLTDILKNNQGSSLRNSRTSLNAGVAFAL